MLLSEIADGKGEPGTVIADPLVVACGKGAIRLLQIQRAGKRPMEAQDFLRGVPLAPGAKLL
ncbi:methionyl-tRNA formyltransferase [Methyloligella halotolerans]|uniref:Methionyl-tRNA formyltransferase n=1 Tax=Methyloligella halotolerans TaxID=1177755 RepID=A0A1E2RUT1_9HYPH|nr:methionyl-tRNA formyltransferase [Methyloligella halotolerans]